MYTECPDCGTAFRVTAKVLQQARGNVRCGGCNNAFNALEYLSEEMPGTGSTEEPEVSVDELAETSRRLLQTLDDLAGPEEVRIEDTGVEWRVLEEIESGIDVDESDAADEPRYDDNSPLPDDIEEEDEPAILLDSHDQGDDDDVAEAHPQRRVSDTHFSVEFNEMQGDLALADPEEWDDLLDEVRDSEPDSLDVEEELASIHSQLATGRDAVDAQTEAKPEAEPEVEVDPAEVELADIDTQFNLQAEALGLDLVGNEDALTDEVPLLPEDAETSADSPADGTSATDPLKTRESSIPYAESNELPDHSAASDTGIATQAEASPDEADVHDSGDDSQTEISDALSDELDEDAETGISEALSEESAGTSDTGINAALQEDLDEDFVTGINEALAEDFDENAETGINEALQDISADADADAPAAVDTEADRDHDAEPEATASSQSTDQDDDSTAANEGKNLADVIRESTGEFEAQIDAAARAFASEDDEDQAALDVEDISSALDVADAESGPDADIEAAGPVDADDADDESEASDSGHFVPPQTDEEMTVNKEIDQELMALATQDDEFSATLVGAKSEDFPFGENSGEVETIIMEGEDVRSDVEQDRLAAESAARNQLDDPIDLADTYAVSRDKLFGGRRKYDPPGYAVVATVIVLVVALGAQFIHNSREILATTGFFNQTIGPVYRMLGDPVTPAWNIKGWQFEVTNGSIEEAESALVIVSRLVNRDSNPLPYPLVHVSLTDRWEDVMGSRILEPGEYLAGAVDADQPVLPGENFTAVITIDNPAAEATGFKLNVCYREGPETVRCAIEDFKN
jgi:predicted Zn finger-like uncharacterized protein